jgi:O-antigen/teichoic acid export membrane protein
MLAFLNLKNILFSQTSKDSLYLLIGTIISVAINFVLVVILTNNLGPAQFGLFITALVFSQLVIDMFELGVNSATINYVSSTTGLEKNKYILTSLLLKVVIAALVSLGVLFLSSSISSIFFKNIAMIPFVQISAIGIFLMIIVNWAQSFFQAEKKFIFSSIVNASPNVSRLLLFLLFILGGSFTVISVYLGYQLVLIISVIIIFLLSGANFIKSKIEYRNFKNILTFGLPIGLGFLVSALYSRLDQLMLFNLAGEYQAGIYGLASKLSTTFVFIVVAFTSAYIPRLTTLEDSKFKTYFSKVLLVSFILGLLALLSIIFTPLIIYIFGSEYQMSIQPLIILMVGIFFFTLSSPFISVLVYKFKMTKISLILAVLSLIILFLLLNLLVPLYQANGAAISLSLLYLIQLVLSLGIFLVKVRKLS